MPDIDPHLIDRLDALGARAAEQVPPLPAGLVAAVAARRLGAGRVPFPAMAAAIAVIAAGGALVLFGFPVRPRGGALAVIDGRAVPATLLSMMSRFNRGGSVDAAVAVSTEVFAPQGPVYRAGDARSGTLPE